MSGVKAGINQALAAMGLGGSTAAGLMTGPEEHTDRLQKALRALKEELRGTGELMTDARAAVLKLTAAQLLKKLGDGTVTAVFALQAYQAMAIEESKRTNCVTEFIPEAKEWAQNLDKIRQNGSAHELPPLHGLPLSVKDSLKVKGLDTTLGLRKKVGLPAEEDAVLVQMLKKLGAVPFVKTNVCQMCISIGCSNPVWGETVNPHDKTRTCGGSSGGEAALIAGGGSLLGLGSDVGGSIRLPAAFCGIVGLKPTARRMCNKGLVSALPGIVGVYGTAGLLGQDCETVITAFKALISAGFSDYDVNTPPIPWRENIFLGDSSKKSLRIGWYDDNGLFPVTPGVKRAVAETVNALQAQGHELVPFKPPVTLEAMKLYVDLMLADQGETACKYFKGEIVDPSLAWYHLSCQVPAKLTQLAKPYIKHQLGEIVSGFSTGNVSSAYELWVRLVERAGFEQSFIKSWKDEDIDVVLCPCFPMPAPTTEAICHLTLGGSYCQVYNLMDFPAATVPVTRESEEDQDLLAQYDGSSDVIYSLIKQDCVGCTGLPISVQLVALPFCDELLCRAMACVTNVANFTL